MRAVRPLRALLLQPQVALAEVAAIAESDPASGYLAEALMAAIAQGSDEAKVRLKDFLEKRGKKVLRG